MQKINQKRSLGTMIRGLRRESDISIKQLSINSGVSPRQISKIELEEQKSSTIKLKTLRKLSQALNTSLDQLLYFVKYDD